MNERALRTIFPGVRAGIKTFLIITSLSGSARVAKLRSSMNHEEIDSRSLAFGRAIASRLATEPQLIDRARATAVRWMATAAPAVRPALQEWIAALSGPVDFVVHLLTASDQRAVRLRQSNPFAGVLSASERNSILRQFRHDARSA